MNYNPDIYYRDSNNKCRYALGQSGKRTLYAVGLNPSRADDKKPDQTLSKILGFCERNEYDSFMMLNLYPRRSVLPENLSKKANPIYNRENWKHIEKILEGKSNVHFLACWGSPITMRSYFKKNLYYLVKMTLKYKPLWLQIGEMTKGGHPRHPSRAGYDFAFQKFDFNNYLRSLE